jgi:hypothetical protein
MVSVPTAHFSSDRERVKAIRANALWSLASRTGQLRPVDVVLEFSGKRPLARRPAIPRRPRALSQLTSAARPNPCDQWRPAQQGE